MVRAFFKTFAFWALAFLATGVQAEPAKTETAPSPWKFSAGISAGTLTPVMLEASVGYKAITLHVEGFGFHEGKNDYWCGVRGALTYSIFYSLPFSLELGVGGGYEFAEAPNEIHRALNQANNAMYLYPYNYRELLDVSGVLRINLLGFFSQISFPALRFKDHDSPDYYWRIGYMVNF